MKVLVCDVGTSKLKFAVYDDDRLLGLTQYSLKDWFQAEDPRPVRSMLEFIEGKFLVCLRKHEIERVMVISLSDSLIYEMDDGTLSEEPTLGLLRSWDRYPEQTVPSYEIAGKPEDSSLQGMAHQLMYLKQKHSLSKIRRVLPVSTFVASHLSGNKDWNHWDITHASNSGMWDYEKSYWCRQMFDYFEGDTISMRVSASNEVLWVDRRDGIVFLVGGHDTVFANANDVPYSTKAYLSFGTWITASVQSWFLPRQVAEKGTRFVIAPNGSVLAQLCLRSDGADGDQETMLKRCVNFLESRIPDKTEPDTVTVFGSWGQELLSRFGKNTRLRWHRVEKQGDSYLHRQAARFMRKVPATELSLVGEYICG